MKLDAFLESRFAPWIVLVYALVLGLAGIKLGFYVDDYAIRAALSGTWPSGPAAWDLYRFSYGSIEANRDAIVRGALPWWTAVDVKVHLMRPLSSILFLADARVFGMGSSLGWHLHSIAWYVVLVHLVGSLLRAILPRATATLAMLVYAVSAAHFFPYGWIACRHMVIAAVFGLLGLLPLVRGNRRGPWLFALGLAASLAASEVGVGVAIFGITWMIANEKRGDRAQRLVPTGLVLAAWLAAYVALDGGAAHSDGYVDPTSAPVRFAAKAATMLPVLIANAILGIPAELALIAPLSAFAGVGVAAAALVAGMWRSSTPRLTNDERSALPWLASAAVLAIVPSLGGLPGSRILLVPNLGFAPLIAVLIRRGFASTDRGATLRVLRAAGAGLLVLVHVIAAPLLVAANASANAKAGRRLEAIATSVDLASAPKSGARFFIMGASDPLVTMFPPLVLLATSPEHVERLGCWSIVSGSKQPHRITRTGPNEILVQGTERRLVEAPFEAFFHSTSDPFHVGDEVRQCDALYRVEAVENGRPTLVRLTLDVPFEDASLQVLHWTGDRLAPFELPRVGDTVVVPWGAGPLEIF